MILGVDIGGTKVNLGLFEYSKDKLILKLEDQYASKEYPSFLELLENFVAKHSSHTITMACFGIAGPIIDEKCITTNLPWSIDANDLRKFLKTRQVSLINDLEATAYGMLYLDESKFVHLNPKGIKKDGNKAIIAAGTGLGEAQLFFHNATYYPIGCEGGHTDFAPVNPLQDKLLIWLREKFSCHVSYERILCGSGVFLLYQFLCELENREFHSSFENISKDDDKSALVSKLALEDKDPLAIKALELFCKIYGAEAGNLALKSMSLGGVYIGGGIAPKILPILKENFLESFLQKGRFAELLESMEIKVSMDDKTALFGAAYYARDN